MGNSKDFDELLKQALSSTETPSEELNQQILNQLKERVLMRPIKRKKLSTAIIAAALIAAMSITAVAAWNYLKPQEIARHFQDEVLAQAFESEEAQLINESVISNGYKITFHGIVSGQSLSAFDFHSSADHFDGNRSYAVVSIEKTDGTPMPAPSEEAYGDVQFFVSPLIKGEAPWLVNIASMNGGYSETVIDGISYRLIQCDNVEIFADRGLYLAVISSTFYDVNAFDYDESTGTLTPKEDYPGVNVLFNLPIDSSKANPTAAEAYLRELYQGEEPSDNDELSEIDWEKKFENARVIPESVKEVTYDHNGMAHYEFEGRKISIDIESYFGEDNTPKSIITSVSQTDDSWTAVQFTRDAQGKITGCLLSLD